MATITENIELTTMRCSCGIIYAMPEWYRARRQETGESWFCPNGHKRIYSESDKARLEKELTAAKSEAMRERQLRENAERLQAKTERRYKAALCPCCNRSFVALRRHLETKHPDYIGLKKKITCVKT